MQAKSGKRIRIGWWGKEWIHFIRHSEIKIREQRDSNPRSYFHVRNTPMQAQNITAVAAQPIRFR